jgi:hypothetical protein
MLDLDPQRADALLAAMARRRRWLRAALDLALLSLLPIGLAPLALVWLTLTPSGVATLLPYLVSEDATRVTIARVAMHPATEPLQPSTWGVILYDLEIAPTDVARPVVTASQVLLLGADLPRWWRTRELHFRRATLIGLHIAARQQRAAAPRPRPPGALTEISADKASFYDARYTAPADAPLPPAALEGIYADVADLRWDPFERLVHGRGTFSGALLRTGDLTFTEIHVRAVEATGRDLTLRRGTVRWEGIQARVEGSVKGIDRRAAIDLRVELTAARLEDLVRSATGQPSPVSGLADLALRVRSGGELPRGGGYMDAAVRLRHVLLQLPPDTRAIYRDAIRLTPIAKLDDQDRVVLEEMEGNLSLTRGAVTLKDLHYKSKIPVYVRGFVDAERLDILFRIVLAGDPSTHPGVGLRLEGPHTSPTARRATREELLPGFRELKADARTDAKEVRRGHRAERREARKGRAGDDPLNDVDSP